MQYGFTSQYPRLPIRQWIIVKIFIKSASFLKTNNNWKFFVHIGSSSDKNKKTDKSWAHNYYFINRTLDTTRIKYFSFTSVWFLNGCWFESCCDFKKKYYKIWQETYLTSPVWALNPNSVYQGWAIQPSYSRGALILNLKVSNKICQSILILFIEEKEFINWKFKLLICRGKFLVL